MSQIVYDPTQGRYVPVAVPAAESAAQTPFDDLDLAVLQGADDVQEALIRLAAAVQYPDEVAVAFGVCRETQVMHSGRQVCVTGLSYGDGGAGEHDGQIVYFGVTGTTPSWCTKADFRLSMFVPGYAGLATWELDNATQTPGQALRVPAYNAWNAGTVNAAGVGLPSFALVNTGAESAGLGGAQSHFPATAAANIVAGHLFVSLHS